jgi:ferritin-like metal-binding protein YciE
MRRPCRTWPRRKIRIAAERIARQSIAQSRDPKCPTPDTFGQARQIAPEFASLGTEAIHTRLDFIIANGAGIMGFFTKDIHTMDDMLLHGLQDIYYAEQQITKALPKMIEQATNRDLATALKNHLEETNKQIERLDQAFKKLGKKPSGTDCPAIDGLIKESDETAGEIADRSVLDAAIVANAQAVEHYEMARYGTLIAWAEELGHDDIVRFLTTNLNEEKAANTKLNTVALRKGVNRRAAS